MMPRSWRFLTALLVLLFLSICEISARELEIQNFHADVQVSPDGSINVTEKIRVHFIGSWRGLYRSIPIEYVSPQGFNYTLFVDVKRVTDEDGRALRYDASRERHYRKLKIYVPGAFNATHTISIEYSVADGLRFFEDHDELYWNVTGDLWDYPIQSASATIQLPAGTTNIRANQFTGSYGSRAQDADVQVSGNDVEVHTRDPLPFHEGLTIAVAFDKGFVKAPTAFDKFSLFIRSNWPLLIPVAALFLMFYLWWTRGRDPRLRPIAAQYEPPNQLTPGECGTLIDDSADMRDITATIVDLAVRGFMVIEEHDQTSMLGLKHDKDFNFILNKDRSGWSVLKAHEQVLLNGIFSAGTVGETVPMSSLQNRFYKNLSELKSRIFESLVSLGYYRRRPDSVRSFYIAVGFIVGFLMVWGGGALGSAMGMAPQTFIITGILTGVIICAFGWFMPAHTEARHTRCRRHPGLRGFSRARGVRSLQPHDQNAANVREISAFRHGAGRRTKLE